jgi:hypothetical protein
MQDPWLGPGLRAWVEWQSCAQALFILDSKFPNNEFVVSSMPTKGLATAENPRCKGETAYVTTLSLPQPASPRRALVWACQTALGLMMVRSQAITKPSASPVRRRSLPRMKAAAWTEALWPRRIDLGCGGRSSTDIERLDGLVCKLPAPKRNGCVFGSPGCRRSRNGKSQSGRKWRS